MNVEQKQSQPLSDKGKLSAQSRGENQDEVEAETETGTGTGTGTQSLDLQRELDNTLQSRGENQDEVEAETETETETGTGTGTQSLDLQGELDNTLDDLRRAEVDVEKNKAQVKALTDLLAKIGQAEEDYRTKHADLDAKQEEYQSFFKDEKTCLESVLGEISSIVCDAAKEATTAIGLIEREIATQTAPGEPVSDLDDEKLESEDDLESKKELRARKQRARDESKKELEAWMNPVKSIEARFKELEKLKAEVCREHEAQNFAYAYYRLVCDGGFEGRLDDDPQVVETDALRRRIDESWEAYSKAENELIDVDAAIETLETELEAKKKQLAEAKKALDATIRDRLSGLNTQQSQAA